LKTERHDAPAILHVVPSDGIGGVEVAFRSMLARADLPCTFRVLLIAGKTLAADPARVVESPYPSVNSPLAQLRALRIILRSPPDVLICSLWRSIPVALAVRMMRPRVRLAFFLHAEQPVHWVDALLSRLAMMAADEIWCDCATTLQGRVPARLTRRARTISMVTGRLQPALAKAPGVAARFTVWARLTPQKGIDRALRFIAALVARGVDARFDIWGPDGGQRSALEALSDQLGISRQVRFLGPAAPDALAEIARQACFFLQLSRFEGMALGVVEAMQFGLVPIVTPVGETAHYVVDNSNGLVVDAEAPETGLAAILRLLGDQNEFERLRTGAIRAWQSAPLYADDVCRRAAALTSAMRRSRGPNAGSAQG